MTRPRIAQPGWRILAAILVLAPALAGKLAPAQTVTTPARVLSLAIGRGELVTLPARINDVFIANEAIADVHVKSSNQLYIYGKSGGETTVYASNARGEVVWSANIRVGTNLDSIDQMLHLAMPDARIAIATMNGTVLLTGTVNAPQDAAEAERLVKAFVGEKVNVISRLKMATPLQVNLSVKIAEVSRTLVRDIGMNWASSDSTGGFKFGIGQGRSFAPQYTPGATLGTGTSGSTNVTVITPTSTGTTLAAAGKLAGLDLLGALDLGETIGLVTVLSEPNLTALSGETAEFLAGGQYPIPINSGLGATSVEYKNYGVSLSYTPTVLASGRISLRVRPEVSELSSQGAVALNGYSIPALTVRRAETTVELGSGQSFMIAGLLQNSNSNTITKLPGAGDIPVLGSLFRSTAFNKGETELVIIVTPYLVNPVDPGDIHLPTDGFRAADAVQQLIGNRETAAPPKGASSRTTAQSGASANIPANSAPKTVAPGFATP